MSFLYISKPTILVEIGPWLLEMETVLGLFLSLVRNECSLVAFTYVPKSQTL